MVLVSVLLRHRIVCTFVWETCGEARDDVSMDAAFRAPLRGRVRGSKDDAHGRRTVASAGAAHDTPTMSRWRRLLYEPESWSRLDERARGADARVLRRKGHLKEQDQLIEFMMAMHLTHTPMEVMQKMERWLREHAQDAERSTLRRLVPSVGRIHTPLRLVEALKEYDEHASLLRRRFVKPNFAEIRHVLNIAQLRASAEQLRLITFDADGTLYADGHHIEQEDEIIGHVVALLRFDVHVAIVTAAGYPGDVTKFQGRIRGLLAAFQQLHLPKAITDRFHIMGGECNYLLRVTEEYGLEFVPDEEWQSQAMRAWEEKDIEELLSEAQNVLLETASYLRLEVQLLRKERSVGILPQQPTIYEVLEDIALSAQHHLTGSKVPCCAFNGGNDVFVDVGNKSMGLEALMDYLRVQPNQALHVGDRFTVSGNDRATRDKCPILWVANPGETTFFISLLMNDIQQQKKTPYIE